MKKDYAGKLSEGDLVDSSFLVKVNSTTKQDNGLYRLNGELRDLTGTVPYVRFDADEKLVEQIGPARVLGVRGRAGKTRYNPMEVRVQEFYIVKDEEIESSDYEPLSPVPLSVMKSELYTILGTLKDADCIKLAAFAFPSWYEGHLIPPQAVEDMENAFFVAPGAVSMHHAYKHGLLQHTLDVTRAARALAQSSPEPINLDVVTLSALLHDIGKVLTYAPLPNMAGYDYTQKGNLLGHIVLGLITVGNYIGAIRMLVGFDENIGDHILHCIASHHSKREYGSPVTPMTLEAMCVARADGYDAEAFRVRKARAEYVEGGRDSIKIHDNFYFVAPLDSHATLCEVE